MLNKNDLSYIREIVKVMRTYYVPVSSSMCPLSDRVAALRSSLAARTGTGCTTVRRAVQAAAKETKAPSRPQEAHVTGDVATCRTDRSVEGSERS
jgi:hypothetical protein